MKSCKRILPLLLVLLFLPVTVFAAGSIDPNAPTSLKIYALHEQTPLKDMEFFAYQVAAMDSSGELAVTASFADYAEKLNIRGKNDGAWRSLAAEMERAIVLQPDILPKGSAIVDMEGVACFESLPTGLYLILSEGIELEGYVYTTSAFFVQLPAQDAATNTWDYTIVANAKPSQNPVLADYEVIKIWKDDCHKAERPASITVDLLCDGEVYDTVTLPQDGHWSYTWTDLNVNHKWTVIEAPQEGYSKPEVILEGNSFIITNTCSKPTAPVSPTLPQTGQLWWPVPTLLAAGLLFIIIGLLWRRRSSDET